MLKKQFSALNPFLRLKPKRLYIIGGQTTIPLGNMTVEQFNSLVDGIDNIKAHYVSSSDAWVRFYPKDATAYSLVRAYIPAILKIWNGAEAIREKDSYISFNLKCSKATLNDIVTYLNQIVAGGPIVEMCKGSKVVDSSQSGRQKNGQLYSFNKAQTIITTETKNKAEEETGQDVDGDGYVGDPANGNKAKTEEESMSFTTIIVIMAVVLLIAVLIKNNKK